MGIGALSRKPMKSGGGDNLGRLVFLGEIRTYLRGRTFACLHNSSIRDVG